MKSASATPSRFRVWCLAVRPRTLPAAVGPVLVGTAAATADQTFTALPALAALIGALLLQIAVNLANDFFDNRYGIDTDRRVGPMRVTQSGLIPPGVVLRAMGIALASAVICGGYLVAVGGWPIIAIGLASLAGVLGYSGGPYPMASHGLGDLLVFIFFGPVAVCGTYYVQARMLPGTVLIWAIPPGLLIAAILVVNNLRDRDTDREAGKRTLAVMIGARWTRYEYTLLILAAYTIPALMLATGASPPVILLPFLTLPLGGFCIRKIYQENGKTLNTRLGSTAMLSLWFSVLLSIGIAVS